MKKFNIILSTIIFIFVVFINKSQSQLVVTSLTPEQAILNVLLGGGVTATNITFKGTATGTDASLGKFKFGSSGVNAPFSSLDSGLIICTGRASEASGAASLQRAFNGVDIVDAQLTSISTNAIKDGFVLEFDFIPMSDSISFQYVFASEEYPEFSGSSFNDVFGFFLTGPNPNGGNYTNQNIAIIPGTTLPVSINTVNNGTTNAGPCVNCVYYNNNSTSTTIAYDGSTVVLTARALVTRCQTYHIKLGVADVSDGSHDSGVFLKGGSFKSKSVNNYSCEFADILNFTVPNQVGASVISPYSTPASASANVLSSSNITSIVPTFQLASATSISPNSGVAQDFSNPIMYTVTAANLTSTKDWKVIVNVLPPLDWAEITDFTVPNMIAKSINSTTKTVIVQVPVGTNLSSLTPTIAISPGATISPASGVAQNFSTPKQYTVTAENTTTQKNWTVSMTTNPINIANFTKNEILITPNPAKNNVYITAEQRYDLTLYDFFGKNVYSQKIETGRTNIDLSNYAKGIYFVKLSNSYENRLIKLIKE